MQSDYLHSSRLSLEAAVPAVELTLLPCRGSTSEGMLDYFSSSSTSLKYWKSGATFLQMYFPCVAAVSAARQELMSFNILVQEVTIEPQLEVGAVEACIKQDKLNSIQILRGFNADAVTFSS